MERRSSGGKGGGAYTEQWRHEKYKGNASEIASNDDAICSRERVWHLPKRHCSRLEAKGKAKQKTHQFEMTRKGFGPKLDKKTSRSLNSFVVSIKKISQNNHNLCGKKKRIGKKSDTRGVGGRESGRQIIGTIHSGVCARSACARGVCTAAEERGEMPCPLCRMECVGKPSQCEGVSTGGTHG